MRIQEEGFTLIEVLIALMILSFVALGIAGLFSHAMLVNASGHDYAVLASEARFALETLQARPFTDPALLATAGTPRAWAPVTRDFTIEYTVDDFFVQNWAEVSAGVWPAPGTNTPNLKRISMTVSSTNQVLKGRRVLTVSSLKIPG